MKYCALITKAIWCNFLGFLFFKFTKIKKNYQLFHWYLGKLRRVGTWQVRWKTFGHFSQHKRSPPFWQTAHQSSFGSSSLLLPSPPILAGLWMRLRTGDFPLTRLLSPDCLQLSFVSVGSVFTWFSRLANASNSLSKCRLVERGGVKLLSGLLNWNKTRTKSWRIT